MLLRPYTAVCPKSFLSGEAILKTKKRPISRPLLEGC